MRLPGVTARGPEPDPDPDADPDADPPSVDGGGLDDS